MGPPVRKTDGVCQYDKSRPHNGYADQKKPPRTYEKPASLYPVKFEEAVKKLLEGEANSRSYNQKVSMVTQGPNISSETRPPKPAAVSTRVLLRPEGPIYHKNVAFFTKFCSYWP